MSDIKLTQLSKLLSPQRPIRSTEHLLGRMKIVEDLKRELQFFHGIPFVYGYRGVGKTSLARTAAQIVTPSDREHIYVACAHGSKMLHIFREIGEELIRLALKLGVGETLQKRVEVKVGLRPEIKASFEKQNPTLPDFEDANAAIRILKQLDELIPKANSTVIVLDEIEELNEDDRTDLAYLIKQIGDQDFRLKFILVGIAENVHELIGAHQSVPRYIKEIYLEPLMAQYLMDIVSNAAKEVAIEIPDKILKRIAIIGNGFPHFSHLMGLSILTEAIIDNQEFVTDTIYQKGVDNAVNDSIQELKIAYEAATQRGEDHYKLLVWSMAHSDYVDVRIDDWKQLYAELSRKLGFHVVEEKKIRAAIGNLGQETCGKIIRNTPARYGSVKQRYRHKRFSSTLMKGHVRLQAEKEGYTLGNEKGL